MRERFIKQVLSEFKKLIRKEASHGTKIFSKILQYIRTIIDHQDPAIDRTDGIHVDIASR
jgi:hypothetical protein